VSDISTDSYDTQIRRETNAAVAERRDFLAGLTDGTPAAPADQNAAATAVITDTGAATDRRVEVIRRSSSALAASDGGVTALLGVVADRADATEVRAAALDALRGASFLVGTFARHRTAYRDVLRDLLSDTVPELREVAVATLAQEHDPVVQETLADGLDGNGDLPVDRPTAIRALAEDDHLDNLPRLRELLASGSPDERQEAIRYLGSYPEARDEVEAALRDQDEYRAVRQQSAASLRALDPARFQEVAKEIATDSGDYDDVRTVSLTALQHLGDTEAVYRDGDFLDRVREIRDESSAPQTAAAAQEMLDHGPDS
jgi:hypothetical protein